MKVKICGITNLEDALSAVILGASALGFIFYRRSPRYISPRRARNIIRLIPREIIKVGVFVNAKEKRIRQIARMVKLDMLQFHGDETPDFCRRFKGYKIIKAFRVKDKLELKEILRYKTFGYLFDTFSKKNFGGTGKRFNWKLLKNIGKLKQKIFLSGGLNARNVRYVVRYLHPDWVDVSSSLERSPGKKDPKKIKAFIQVAKKLDR
ncbi:MAG: phosphoribosylanthranilate isomerase [Candidatus Omnitrophica bacterium]|nr:phosphoribosylanthranilate isomerase [Candidatus Omnitrophota bacterium]